MNITKQMYINSVLAVFWGLNLPANLVSQDMVVLATELLKRINNKCIHPYTLTELSAWNGNVNSIVRKRLAGKVISELVDISGILPLTKQGQNCHNTWRYL